MCTVSVVQSTDLVKMMDQLDAEADQSTVDSSLLLEVLQWQNATKADATATVIAFALQQSECSGQATRTALMKLNKARLAIAASKKGESPFETNEKVRAGVIAVLTSKKVQLAVWYAFAKALDDQDEGKLVFYYAMSQLTVVLECKCV